MFSRGRVRAANFKLEVATKYETTLSPSLLFLYPRWFSTSFQSSLNSSSQLRRYIRLDQPVPTQEHLSIKNATRTKHAKAPTATFELAPTTTLPKEQPEVDLTRETIIPESLPQSHVAEDQEVLGSIDYGKIYRDRRDLSQMEPSKAFRKKSIDWIPLARMLANIPFEPDLSNETRLHLTDNVLFELTGSTSSNMWIHNIGSGCKIHVPPKIEPNSNSQLVRLQGSQRARELTKEYLQKVGKHSEDLTTNNSIQRASSNISVQDIRSVRTFSSYVSQLLKPTPRLVWKSISPDQTQNESIAAAFSSLFSNPGTSQFASVLALNKVLKFLSKHSELTASLNVIYNKAQELGLKPNVESYNILIAFALKNYGMENIRKIISDMQKSKTAANGRTWIILFSAIDSMIGRRELLIRMKEQGVKLDTTTIGSIARVFVDEAFPKVSDNESEWTEFVKQMDMAFGSIWLFSTTFNRMVYHCATMKRFDLATKVLELTSRRRMKLDNSNLIHLLGLCRRKGNLKQSISILTATHSQNLKLESLSISSVFMTAWNKRFYNLCRVLWRYAASHGLITQRMQDVVQKSLKKNTTKSETGSEFWRRLAGKIIVGSPLEITISEFPLLSRQYPTIDPMKWLMEYTINDGTRTEQLSFASKMISQDLHAWKYFEPMSRDHFLDLLDNAYEKDCDWMTKKLSLNTSKDELVELAVKVDLKRLTEPRQVFQRQRQNVGKKDTILLSRRSNDTENEEDMRFRVSKSNSQSRTSWTSIDLPLDQRKAFIQRLSDMFQDEKRHNLAYVQPPM